MKPMERTQPFALEDWIVEPELHQISLGSTKVALEPRVMSVLLELAAHPQRVIAKGQFLRAVWPDTNVGEDALTRCISQLRHVLRDDPHNPHFIKTIPKMGYCLLVQVRLLEALPPVDEKNNIAIENEKRAHSPAAVEVEDKPAAASDKRNFSRQTLMKSHVGAFGVAAVVLLVASVMTVMIERGIRKKPASPIDGTFQLTTDAGEQSLPALSVSGNMLAFVWAKENGGPKQIYIKELGSDRMTRLTDLPGDEDNPVWSPDGRRVAFLSSSATGLALYVAALHDPRSVHKIYIPGANTRWEEGAVAWSPDGKSFILADHLGSNPSSSLYRIDAQTMLAGALTHPPTGWEGDLSPAFSPDGQRIGFLRASENAVMDIYWIPAGGGEPKQITHDGKTINGITWSSDNRSIIFSSNRAGEFGLWTVDLEGGAPRRMPVGTENATQPTIPQTGKNLAFVQGSALFGILRVSTSKDESHPATNSMIVSSTGGDSAPSVSPDGRQFAFQSSRSGNQEIWASSIDGQSLRRLTPAGGDLSGSGSPSWSPSGDQILFDSRIHGHSHIFLIPSSGGTPSQITFGEANDIVPRWSADGNSIYFRSNRGGRWQLWKLAATGGNPQPVTRDDGMVGQESADGRWLYFARGGESGIWRMPAAGGEEVRILDQPAAGYWAYWTLGPRGLYFLNEKDDGPEISVYDPLTGKTTGLAKLDRMPPLFSGLSLFHDGRSLLISDKHDAGSHISVAQGTF
jgi:Tol biopolymer transport system component/DNA-binding winged helix-turn-helix (wHTH) protein